MFLPLTRSIAGDLQRLSEVVGLRPGQVLVGHLVGAAETRNVEDVRRLHTFLDGSATEHELCGSFKCSGDRNLSASKLLETCPSQSSNQGVLHIVTRRTHHPSDHHVVTAIVDRVDLIVAGAEGLSQALMSLAGGKEMPLGVSPGLHHPAQTPRRR